jgi:hypothetical protein
MPTFAKHLREHDWFVLSANLDEHFLPATQFQWREAAKNIPARVQNDCQCVRAAVAASAPQKHKPLPV